MNIRIIYWPVNKRKIIVSWKGGIFLSGLGENGEYGFGDANGLDDGFDMEPGEERDNSVLGVVNWQESGERGRSGVERVVVAVAGVVGGVFD